MTLPLAPEPRLSVAARPMPRITLPPPPPDRDRAARQFLSGVTTDREGTERQLLANALASPAGVEALRTLDPQELSTPLHRNVAQVIFDLDDQGVRPDAAAVTAELAQRPLNPFPVDDRLDREGRFLLAALDGGPELAQLMRLEPAVFSAKYETTARVMQDLVGANEVPTAFNVRSELDRRKWSGEIPTSVTTRNTQLPSELNPARHPNPGDLRTFGLRGWEYSAFATDSISHPLAQQVRAYTRQERGLEAARRAVERYGAALEKPAVGPVADWVGHATHDLATEIVAIPKALPAVARPHSESLNLPAPPLLSAAGRRALRP